MSAESDLLATAQRARHQVRALQVQNDLLREANRRLAEDNDRLSGIADNALDMVEQQSQTIEGIISRLRDTDRA